MTAQNKPKHAPFPTMPADALQGFLAVCERTPGPYQGFYDHETGWVVMAMLDNGRVDRWSIHGPMTEADAMDLIGHAARLATAGYGGGSCTVN